MDWAAFAAGCGTILAGVAGVMTARASILRAKREGEQRCEDELTAEREQSERLARELHRRRLEHPDE